ncbi:Sec-independent protein translocase protein tatB homolog [Candidatus Glomeribacter gigasporarum BEG34]|uniref:Sec-independent protein translocase protein TatB n=2 Tax=Candidatus Glomeribacter gigasporarum TaxID=132144 RepID=G2J7H5_9BURK|nr:Sec-independent protein translocase protein tatB homolog [Candidatus Glomeribacter gigasporarum BEG34]
MQSLDLMLELGLAKLALIALVALVVIGPERLPRVARTAGMLLGRAQRCLNEIRDEVNREIELKELQQVKTEFEQSARCVDQTLHASLREALMTSSAQRMPAPARRRNWHIRRKAPPLWRKRMTVRHRAYVQSGAARMMRHRPALRRRRIHFF